MFKVGDEVYVKIFTNTGMIVFEGISVIKTIYDIYDAEVEDCAYVCRPSWKEGDEMRLLTSLDKALK